MTEVTHLYLVIAGAVWVRKRSVLVFCELVVPTTGEQPDVIGWTTRGGGECHVIECKASRADFLSNKHKGFERLGVGVGHYRWYLVPKGIVTLDDVAEGWGLLELRRSGHDRGHYIKKLIEAPPLKPLDGMTGAAQQERKMLITLARREHMFEVGGKGWED